MELWKDIPSLPGYKASSYGRIEGPGSRNQPRKILSIQLTDRDREQVNIFATGMPKHNYVHHLVAEAFIGVRPDGMETHHIDFDHHNNKPENLEYLTKGVHYRKHGKVYLSDEQIVLLRQMFKEKRASAKELMLLTGVKQTAIYYHFKNDRRKQNEIR